MASGVYFYEKDPLEETRYLSTCPARGRWVIGSADNGCNGEFFRAQPAAAVAARMAVPRGVDDPLSADGAGELSRRRQRHAT